MLNDASGKPAARSRSFPGPTKKALAFRNRCKAPEPLPADIAQVIFSTQDPDGREFGGRGRAYRVCRPTRSTKPQFDAYLELHIEQRPNPGTRGHRCRIVTGGYKCYGFQVDIRGETAHCGPTPMELRRNAAVGAGRIIAAVDDIGWKYAAEDGKSTTSHVSCWPGIPG